MYLEEDRISVLVATLVFARLPPLSGERLVKPCRMTGNPTPRLQDRPAVIYISACDSEQKRFSGREIRREMMLEALPYSRFQKL